MNADFPAPRRYAVDIGTTGFESVRFGDTHPNLCGWVISWVTNQGTTGALPQCVITCADRFFEQAELEFGDDDTAPAFSLGGRVYIPYPTITLGLYDAAGIGDINVQLIGRPVHLGDDPGARTSLVSYSRTQVLAANAAVLAIPVGAGRHWTVQSGIVNVPLATSVNVSVQGGAAFASNWDQYELNDDGTQNPLVTGAPWRNLPPVDASSPGRLRFDNDDAAQATFVATYFEFDFAAGH